MAFKLKMLQIVIMTGEVRIDLVLPQQRIPLRDRLWVIAMLSIAVRGMMCCNLLKER
jgi:hypothetical protein